MPQFRGAARGVSDRGTGCIRWRADVLSGRGDAIRSRLTKCEVCEYVSLWVCGYRNFAGRLVRYSRTRSRQRNARNSPDHRLCASRCTLSSHTILYGTHLWHRDAAARGGDVSRLCPQRERWSDTRSRNNAFQAFSMNTAHKPNHAERSGKRPAGYERYQDLQLLGVGGIGRVSSCFDPTLDRRVALKVLQSRFQNDQRSRRQFVHEARAMARLEHPNITPVYELGELDDRTPYFTMKEVHGISLLDVLTGLKGADAEVSQRYQLHVLVEIFQRVCEAVGYAHSHGVMHCDLKPENILIGGFGEVQLMDWGLAREVLPAAAAEREHGTPAHETGTHVGRITGTLRYMAPEQASGNTSQLDGRSDIHSLGAILYEILTLQYSAPGQTMDAVLQNIIHSMPKRPRCRARHRNIPRELDAICMTCLAKRKEDRYTSVGQLLADLTRFRTHQPVSVCRYSLGERGFKWAHRHASVSTAACTALVALILGISALSFARHVRFQTSFSQAEWFRAEGNRLFLNCTAVLRELSSLASAEEAAALRRAELTALANKLHGQFENQYETALVLYSHAVPARDFRPPRTLELGDEYPASASSVRALPPKSEPIVRAVVEIFHHRVEYAIATRDYAEAQRLFDFLRAWCGRDYERMSPELQTRTHQLENRTKGLQGSAASAR